MSTERSRQFLMLMMFMDFELLMQKLDNWLKFRYLCHCSLFWKVIKLLPSLRWHHSNTVTYISFARPPASTSIWNTNIHICLHPSPKFNYCLKFSFIFWCWFFVQSFPLQLSTNFWVWINCTRNTECSELEQFFSDEN